MALQGPFVLPEELSRILATPGTLSGERARRARKLYYDANLNLNPQWDLSNFGAWVFIGHFEEVKKEYELNHPDLNGTETCFQTGYISLAVLGSQRMDSESPTSQHAKVIVFLILKGAPIDLPDIIGSTALHHAAFHNKVPKVLQVLFNGKPDPNARDRCGATPVHTAMMRAQAEALERCLVNGGDPDLRDGGGISPAALLSCVPPAISAILTRYMNKKSGITEILADKGKCVVCGKSGTVMKCEKCRVARYCSVECQRTHWRNGHNRGCISFEDPDATIVFKISRMPYTSLLPVATLRNRVLGEPPAEGSKTMKEKRRKATIDPTSASTRVVLGKTVIVKVQLPTRGTGSMMVYNKSQEFKCQLEANGQREEYSRLEEIIQEKGMVGLKGYFMAEIGEDTIRIKASEVLANQPW
ncbi:hypothetical protein M408DRAFT_26968 [Serendipita vermifera MAFF 305830]|uniref:MYND-type domain-containing protein n=1 Tax=Serendipita vermifera MAFF 305830 TaxID=933852 RepID=A0A0C2WDE1_SERVB|nr:hypothetical protein M408DRAFT_26968 [Serendipita vermifera MAFF 305830]